MHSFLGIDLGGSSCKAVLVDTSGSVVAGTSMAYRTRRGPGGEVTQKPVDWEKALVEATRAVLDEMEDVQVEAMALTAPAHAVALVGGNGSVLGPVMTAQDARPDAVARRLAAASGDEIYARTMVPLSSGWTLAQLAWLASERPDLATRTEWVLPVKDYLRYRLTGEAACDPSDAAGTALYDPLRKQWDPYLAELSGFALASLPPVMAPTAVGGGLRRSWARRLELKAGLPVVIGATDTAAELISVGARDIGSGMVKLGSTGTAVGVSDRPCPSRGTFTYPHPDPGKWYSVAATSTAGTAYEWLLAVLGGTGAVDDVRSRAYALARHAPPGSDGLLFFPYLEGERAPYWMRELRGAFVGLSSAHTTAHLCRAVLEGVAMSVGECYKVLETLGVAPTAPVMTGGGSQSELWRRMLAAVLDKRCVTVAPHGPGVGAAMLAAEGVTGQRLRLRTQRRQVRCPPGWATIYRDRFTAYRRTARHLVQLAGDEELESA